MSAIKNSGTGLLQENKINEVLTRGVSEFIDPDGAFKKKLLAKVAGAYPKDIIVKFGIDPTRPDIHLGHAVVLRKLRALQDLGCKAIFLIGDYTAQIGDPIGRSKTRPEIEQKAVEENLKTYLEQGIKILRTEPEVFSWIRNSDWFTAVTDLYFPPGSRIDITIDGQQIKGADANSFVAKAATFDQTRMQRALTKEVTVITLRNFLWALRSVTHAALIERDLFKQRIEHREELFMHEMMYPVLQGLDSVALANIYGSCDLEVGGSDQTFNMLMGRHIMKNQPERMGTQAVLAFELLEGLDGKEKMSKSLDNYIGITEAPSQMYGKAMSIPDSLLIRYFELCTYETLDEIKEIKKSLEGGANPKDIKMKLAKEVVSIYHGEKAAGEAEADFKNTFSGGGVPKNIQTMRVSGKELFVDVLLTGKLVASKNEFRRLVLEGAFTNRESGEKISDPAAKAVSGAYRLGKHRFIKIEVE